MIININGYLIDPEQIIRELAHDIWEREDRPEGKALEHWLKAKEMVNIFIFVK